MRDADDESHFYVMKLGAREYLDAGQRGGLARFINHSCDPNCETQTWDVAGEQRIGIFSKRRIEIDEEITYDYQWQRRGFRPTVCRCGSETCKGYLGGLDTRKVPVGQWALPGEEGGIVEGEKLLGEWVDAWLVAEAPEEGEGESDDANAKTDADADADAEGTAGSAIPGLGDEEDDNEGAAGVGTMASSGQVLKKRRTDRAEAASSPSKSDRAVELLRLHPPET